jgi:hypothetical protein
VQVLEALAVAADDDQVHALLVLDGEVAHGPAVGARDAEAQRARAPAVELGLGELEREPAVRDGQAADRIGGGHLHLLLGVRRVRVRSGGAVGTEGAAHQNGGSEDQRQGAGDAGDRRGLHAATA